MSDSLVIAAAGLGPFELIDPEAESPYEATGDRDGEDLGAPVPDTATVAGVLLDGDRVTGEGSRNRSCLIPVRVTGTSRFDLSQKIDTLIRIVNQKTFTVTWTPEDCPSLVLDCFRGTYVRSREVGRDSQWLGYVVLSFPALPFGRSLDQQVITVLASGGTPQLQVDGMNTSSPAFTSASRDTSIKFEGASSAKVTLTRSTVTIAGVTYDRYLTPGTAPGRSIPGGAVDLSGYASMSLRLRWPAPANFAKFGTQVKATLLLTSMFGASYVQATIAVGKGSTAQKLIMFDLADLVTLSGTGVGLSAVVSWACSLEAETPHTASLPSTSDCWLDDLRAYPLGSVDNSTSEGAVLTIPAVKGSARTPVSMEVGLAGDDLVNLLIHRPPTTQDPDLPILLGLSAGTIDVEGAYDGTYSLIAVLSASATASRTVTVTCEQKIGATVIGGLTATVTTAREDLLLNCGLMTLPPARVPAENTDVTYTFTVDSTDGDDAFSDLALCDVRGQTVMLPTLPADTIAVYVDEPDPAAGIGAVYATGSDRTGAYWMFSRTSGGPMLLEPGDNRLLLASSSGAPDVITWNYPRWLDEVAS